MPAEGARTIETAQVGAPALVTPRRTPATGARTIAAPGYVLAGIVLAGGILRFATLSTQSLWADEGFTARIASSTLASAASQVPRTESTPPLYYALIWVWAHVFGSSAVALRSLSAIFGCLTIAAVYWTAVAICSRRVAVIAAAITAVSPIMVWYSQEARSYALFVLLCVLSFGFFARALTEYRRAWLVGWAGCSAAALATHYFAVFPVAVEAGWLLWRARDRRAVLASLVPPVVVGAALLPLLLYQDAHVPRPWTSVYTVKDQVEATAQSFFVGITWTPIIHRGAVAVLAILAILAIVAVRRSGEPDERRVARALVLFAAVALALPLVISLVGTNYLAPRNLLYAWPVLALVVALGAGRRRAGRLSAAALIAGLAICIAIVVAVDTTPRLERDDWRVLLRPLRQSQVSSAVVVVDGFNNSPIVRYYLPKLHPVTRPATVREVDVITYSEQASIASQFLPVRGLPLTSQRVLGHIVLSRFAGRTPVTVPDSLPDGERIFVQASG